MFYLFRAIALPMLLRLIDIFLYTLHIALMVFVVFGWAWPPVGSWHFATLVVMGVVWIVAGLLKVWNCPLTNLHWKVKEMRGQTGMPVSFVNYFLNQVTGKQLSHRFVQTLLLIIYFLALFLSGVYWLTN